MDSDNHPDRVVSEQSDLPNQQHQRSGSMSLGAPPTGDDVSPINGDAPTTTTVPQPVQDPNAKVVHDVVNSEIGVSTLLNRLKQSIASAKEFAVFLKKRSTIEEEHSNGLKKLCRFTSETIRKPDQRHGSFVQSYEEVNTIHERMADNGAQFAISLHQMHEDLLEMAANMERNRKHWKAYGLSAEQRVADTEAAMRKSKAKYDSLADDYDRARTGDRQAGKKFGLKGPKSAAQHEEDLLRKVQAADTDYAGRVQTTLSMRAELWSKLRPEAVRALIDLVKECDSALTLQMQKFASFNEKLLLSNGLNISPLKGAEPGKSRSLREAVLAIDNDKDFSNYVSSFGNKLPPRAPELKYEKHPVLQPVQTQVSVPPQRQSDPPTSFNSRQGPPQQNFGSIQSSQYPQPQTNQPYNNQPPPTTLQQHDRTFSQGPPPQQYNSGPPNPAVGPPKGPPGHGIYNTGSISSSGPPQLSTLPFQTSNTPPPLFPQQQIPSGSFSQQSPSTYSQPPPPAPFPAPISATSYSQPAPAATPYSQPQPPAPYLHNSGPSFSQPPVTNNGNLLPVKPVFGLSLEQLFDRDGSAVPMVVYQCIQAVDLFGLEVEGIYRLSGTASHITRIKSLFDNDASKVDFRNPENFFHDVNSVAGLLKQFFRELPDPLLTAEHYAGFIEAAKHEDDIVRRDSLHAIINSLPDPNYATLRALTLHLNRIQESSPKNRMNASNLAIVFGPTLMGANTGPNIQDAGWQVRVIDTILNNTYQIFDDD